jgi:hypothetical protein
MSTRKQKAAWGDLAERILQAINELGPMTRAELCAHLQQDAGSVSSVVARLRKETPLRPQRLHIGGWVYDQEGQRAYPRAQYALGAQPDKKLNRKLSKSKQRSAHQTMVLVRMKTASVFNLGMTRDQLRAQSRQYKEAA